MATPQPKMPFIITAGPTREYIDPVRFLSNPSTGKMGFAIAMAAARKGHPVILITGPVTLKTPKGVERVDVVSARDMLAAAKKALKECKNEAIFVATAAVADWRPKVTAHYKLKKNAMMNVLDLVRNPDILKTVKARHKVGFAAETDHILAEAKRKCRAKKLAFVVANDVTESGCGFGTDTNRVALVYADGRVVSLPKQTKRALGAALVGACEDLCS